MCDNTSILKNLPDLKINSLRDYNTMVYDKLIDKTMCSKLCPCDPNIDAVTK